MLVRCSTCHKDYVASQSKGGQRFICSNCQKGGEQTHRRTRLGLHPALEKKWAASEHEQKLSTIHLKKQSHSQILSSHTAIDGAQARPKSLMDKSGLPKIPGFEISYQVGRGAMGSVYRARQNKTGRLVAIKVLSQDLSLRSDLVARFEREAYALKSLTNKNVVSIIDAGRVDETHYFAMEFIDGITLRTRINRGPVSVEEAARITLDILNGLKAAHKHGIIHRDLKPENVLLAYDGHNFSKSPERVVLVDFGLVGIGGLAFDPHPNLTRSKVTMGTVNYMAPEQHVDAKRVDHRSDLYSTGVILYEMLTGDLPLGRYSLPHERGMDCPMDLGKILTKALCRSLDDRYASADKFIEDLEKCMALAQEEKGLEEQQHDRKLSLADRFRTAFFKGRHAILLVVAALFFALGIKFSFAKNNIEQESARPVIEDKRG